jgi:membrane protein implicated in regulation of membrane protease activity
MMYAIAAVLAVLWLLGLAGGYMAGGALHLLLIIAVILVMARRMEHRKRGQRSEQQAARSRQARGDIGAQKTWHLK